MALTNKLTAIGDAIREKTGSTELLTLDQMATEIANISSGGGGSWSTATITSPAYSGYYRVFDISNYVSKDNKNWMLFFSATYSSSQTWETAFIAPFLSELYGKTGNGIYGIIYTQSRHGADSSGGAQKILGYSDGFLSDPLNSDKVRYGTMISWDGTQYYQLGLNAVLLYQE